MKPTVADRWKVLSPELDRLLDLDPGAREAYLTQLAGTDVSIANELRSLLAAQASAERTEFLEASAQHPSRRLDGSTLVGTRIGAYTIVSIIGYGGMGSVWLAERDDGLFEGRAAVKLLNLALLGRAAAERFRREGSILAKLSHPAIARLLDAGLSSTAQPYLILEYVDGVCIDAYCRDERLGAREIVELFSQVLTAVAHAHAQLVVHRDIKPGNVMVAGNDGSAQVKLLDFGIAGFVSEDSQSQASQLHAGDDRAAPSAGAAQNELTQLAGHALTVNYASPEQVRRERVSTASDIYSLGVLLYTLLSGRSAYRSERQTPAALEEAILNAEVMPLNHPRNTTTFRIERDLEAIVSKAMALRPEDRYGSVSSFKDDIERYLLGQPVRARGRARGYLAKAFVKRYWLAISGIVACFAAISTAAFLIWKESETLKLTKAFLIETLTPTSYYSDGGGLLSQRELLLRAANQLDTRFKDQPKAAAELYQTIGESLFNMGEHQLSYEVRSRAQPLIDTTYGARSIQAIRNASRVTYMHLTMYRYGEFRTALAALRARCGVSDTDTPNPKCLGPEWMNSMYSVSVGKSREALARWLEMDPRITPLIDASNIWHTLVGYWGATAASSAGDMVRSKQLWQRLLSLEDIQNEPKGNHQYALAIARGLNEAGFQQEAATLARAAFDQGTRYMGEAFDQRLFYLPGVVAIEIGAARTEQAEQHLLRALVRAQTAAVGAPDIQRLPTQESAAPRATLGLLYATSARHELARQRLGEALALQESRSSGYDEWAMRLRIHLAAVSAMAGDRRAVIDQLDILEREAQLFRDESARARIDALRSSVADDVATREIAWQRANSWMQTSHARMPDIKALLSAMGSTRAWPPPVDDDGIAAMRRYAAKILETTELEMQTRARSVSPSAR